MSVPSLRSLPAVRFEDRQAVCARYSVAGDQRSREGETALKRSEEGEENARAALAVAPASLSTSTSTLPNPRCRSHHRSHRTPSPPPSRRNHIRNTPGFALDHPHRYAREIASTNTACAIVADQSPTSRRPHRTSRALHCRIEVSTRNALIWNNRQIPLSLSLSHSYYKIPHRLYATSLRHGAATDTVDQPAARLRLSRPGAVARGTATKDARPAANGRTKRDATASAAAPNAEDQAQAKHYADDNVTTG